MQKLSRSSLTMSALLVMATMTLMCATPGNAVAQGAQQVTQVPSGRPPEPTATTSPDENPPAMSSPTDDPYYSLYRIDLPSPNGMRTADGQPGPEYWQQRADYTLRATLDTTSKTLDGTVTIHYTNNAPVPLTFVWLHLEQNLFRYSDDGERLPGGIDVDHVTVDGKDAPLEVHGTMGRVDLPEVLNARGGHAVISMHFRYVVPERGADRMGRDGSEYMLGQWYPRMVVYDDVHGWNTDPYSDMGEFYLEYGDFDYEVTVPAGYTVTGTGELQNASDVLSAEERGRLKQTETDTAVISIITAAEAQARATQTVEGMKTWHFSARNVRDAVWATAPDFQWDATKCDVGEHHVLCQALYPPRADKGWSDAANATRFSIRHYSSLVFPFPYPVMTSVAGSMIGGGMEYPMITFNGPSAFFVLNHEIGHQWFPMMVGSNERRYAWMDEGFNTYMNGFAAEAWRTAHHDTTLNVPSSRAATISELKRKYTVPLMTSANHGGMLIAYAKTGAALLMLRDYVLGPKTFDLAFGTYAKRWFGKHPTPADFFRTIENVSGEDLGWFWRDYFYTNDVLDYGIDSMAVVSDARGTFATRIHVTRMTPAIFPIVLRVKFADGSTRDLYQPVATGRIRSGYWFYVDSKVPAVGARLWPNQGVPVSEAASAYGLTSRSMGTPGPVPDVNSWNDVWGDAPDPDTAAKPPFELR